MKTLLAAAFAATLLPLAVHAQGQIVFANLFGSVNAPVTLSPNNKGPGPGYTAQLYLVNGLALTPLSPTSTFRPPGPGAAAIADRYWDIQDVIVPGVTPGNAATFVVRAWRTDFGSFDVARMANTGLDWGESAPFTVTVGGGTLPPASLVALQSFTMTIIPEPSTLTLLALGVLALLGASLRKRR